MQFLMVIVAYPSADFKHCRELEDDGQNDKRDIGSWDFFYRRAITVHHRKSCAEDAEDRRENKASPCGHDIVATTSSLFCSLSLFLFFLRA